MKINILKEENKPLLSRIEINAEIIFQGATPSKETVGDEISKQKKKKKNVIVVKNIYTQFGLSKANSLIYIYDNEKVMDNIEPKSKKTEEAPKEEAKTEIKLWFEDKELHSYSRADESDHFGK